MSASAGAEPLASDSATAFHSMEPKAASTPSSRARLARPVLPLCTGLSLLLLVVVVLLPIAAFRSSVTFDGFSSLRPFAFASAPAAPSLPLIGVCLSGLEDGNRIPGRPGVDYGIPTASEYLYFHSKRLDLIRLPFRWERIQPNISGPLDPFQVATLKSQLSIAASLNMSVLLDCHNYARFGSFVINGTTGPLTDVAFADMWRRIATEMHGLKGLRGYDLMNEPNSRGSSTQRCLHSAIAAIDAIRTVDKTTRIYLEGNQWSGANNWTLLNPGFPLSDPSGLITYSAHCYLDRDGSGTHFSWQEETQHGVTLDTGVERLQSFVQWTAAHSVPGHIGEMGIGADDQGWFIAYDRALAVMAAAGLEHTYWGGGPFFETYPMGVDPAYVEGRVQDTRQMAVLSKYSGAEAPQVYFLAGPGRGRVGEVSGNFTLEVRGWLQTAITFQCYDGVQPTPFTALTTSTEWNRSAQSWMNFTYTASAAWSYSIYCTNDAGYFNAEPIVYVAA